MDWSAQVDIYCERLDLSYWAEPLNALTNASFILAGLWALYAVRHYGLSHWSLGLLIALAFAIGIGSFLFHTHATGWAALADVLPIVLFVLGYAVAALALLYGGGLLRVLGLFALVIAFVALTGWLTALSGLSINGTEQYAPAFLLMLLISTVTWMRGHPVLPWFGWATAAFALSLTFRSLDMALCDAWPYGTHIFWHLLNGTVIALLLQGLIRTSTKATPP